MTAENKAHNYIDRLRIKRLTTSGESLKILGHLWNYNLLTQLKYQTAKQMRNCQEK